MPRSRRWLVGGPAPRTGPARRLCRRRGPDPGRPDCSTGCPRGLSDRAGVRRSSHDDQTGGRPAGRRGRRIPVTGTVRVRTRAQVDRVQVRVNDREPVARPVAPPDTVPGNATFYFHVQLDSTATRISVTPLSPNRSNLDDAVAAVLRLDGDRLPGDIDAAVSTQVGSVVGGGSLKCRRILVSQGLALPRQPGSPVLSGGTS